jgi:ribosomal protein S27AE
MMACCGTFSDHNKRKLFEAGAIDHDEKHGWFMVADGGAWAASEMKFCPWCGDKLKDVVVAAHGQ